MFSLFFHSLIGLNAQKMGGYGDCTLAKGTRVLSASYVCTLVPVRAAAGDGGVGPAGSQSALAAPVRRLPGGVVVTYIIPTLFLSSHCQQQPTGCVCVCV